MIRITIEEYDDNSETPSQTNTFEFESFSISQERGVGKYRSKSGKVTDINPNGQKRMTIKAWTGCRIYENFSKDRPDPYQRAKRDCIQDNYENCHFDSIGGMEKRKSMEVPEYILDEEKEEYLAGYAAQAKIMYGQGWQTYTFTWRTAFTLDP